MYQKKLTKGENKLKVKRIDKELSKAVVRELGTQRVKEVLCINSDMGVSHIRREGCPVPYMCLLFYKFPHLLAWKDFDVTDEETLLHHIIKKEENN